MTPENLSQCENRCIHSNIWNASPHYKQQPIIENNVLCHIQISGFLDTEVDEYLVIVLIF